MKKMKKMLIALTLVLEFAHYEFGHASWDTRTEYIQFVRRNPDGTGHRIVTTDNAKNAFGQKTPASAMYPLTQQQFAAFVPNPDKGKTYWTTFYETEKMKVGDPVEVRYKKGGITGFSYESEVVTK